MKTAKDLVNRERFTTTVKLGYKKKFKDISDRTRIPMSKLLDEAIEYLDNKYREDVK